MNNAPQKEEGLIEGIMGLWAEAGARWQKFSDWFRSVDWKKVYSGLQLLVLAAALAQVIASVNSWGLLVVAAGVLMAFEKRPWEAYVLLTVTALYYVLTAMGVSYDVPFPSVKNPTELVGLLPYVILPGMMIVQFFQIGKK